MFGIPRICTATRVTKATISNAERTRRLASVEKMLNYCHAAAEKGNVNAIREIKNLEEVKALILTA